MLIPHDYECAMCGHEYEEFVEWDEHSLICPKCHGVSTRIYKAFGGISRDTADWMKEVGEIVNKDGGQHCQEFLRDPTRSNHKKWMEGEGLRPLEKGEKLVKTKGKRTKKETTKLAGRLLGRLQKREAISIK